MMADEVPSDGRGCRHATRWRRNPIDGLQGAFETVEDAIELHAHLECERPTGAVIRRRRGTAWVRNVVRIVLWLEHIEHVRTEGLRRLHHKRACRIAFAARPECPGRT